jgi:TIR domain/Nucleoside 2-deoxyribosyltransferase
MNLFISYSRADSKYAQELTAALRSKGFDVFLDYDSLSGGEDFSESILSSLRNAELVLFVVPKESGEGKNALYEVGAAKALGKKIFAVMPHGRGSGARDVALGLADLIFLDTSETEPDRVADIVESTVQGRSMPEERAH